MGLPTVAQALTVEFIVIDKNKPHLFKCIVIRRKDRVCTTGSILTTVRGC